MNCLVSSFSVTMSATAQDCIVTGIVLTVLYLFCPDCSLGQDVTINKTRF